MQPQILILGAGFAGHTAALHLSCTKSTISALTSRPATSPETMRTGV
jgi:NADH dehydrogenase FAD-containing subunit